MPSKRGRSDCLIDRHVSQPASQRVGYATSHLRCLCAPLIVSHVVGAGREAQERVMTGYVSCLCLYDDASSVSLQSRGGVGCLFDLPGVAYYQTAVAGSP
jgi:hypothetical protein